MICRHYLFLIALAGSLTSSRAHSQEDLNDHLERMTKEAARRVAPSVVQIQTQGGADMVVTTPKGPAFRKAMGPTTGVIVAPDGYIVSSAYNFLNSPATIVVNVPGRPQPLLAQRVATDRSRMLTLLKIDAKGLPVPAVAPKREIRVGAWAIALGRTLDNKSDAAPSISVGIISALGRIWGKALQTDAKISPINYGGPLVDIQGRVQGILIPASPSGQDETAGYEWYDSGIGFAIPMEDVLAVLPRLKQGKDLQRGILGIRMKSADIYSAAPEIGQVQRDTAAARAGLKPGDVITEFDGKPVVRMAQVQHLLGPKYVGDKVALKYKRDAEIKSIADLTLVEQNPQVAQPFLGILPLRDDPRLGVEVRYVYLLSPADKAGIKPGDRIVKYGTTEEEGLTSFLGAKRGRLQLLEWLNTQAPGSEVKFELVRKAGGKTETVSVKLEPLPDAQPDLDAVVPDKLPQPASAQKAMEPLETAKPAKQAKAEAPKKAETGFLKKTTADGEHKYWAYVPEEYEPNIAHAVVVWLHPLGKNKYDDGERLADLWEDFCKDNHIIMVGPLSQNEGGWVPSEADAVVAATQEILNRYTVDRQRLVAHGMGVGGQMALHLAFNQRDLFRAAATVGAVVTQVKDNVANQRLTFYLAAGGLDPLSKNIAAGRTKLATAHYGALYREIPNRGREYLEEAQLRELVRWIDSLDRE
jgi:serine protease Do